jgi:hypothetical protein
VFTEKGKKFVFNLLLVPILYKKANIKTNYRQSNRVISFGTGSISIGYFVSSWHCLFRKEKFSNSNSQSLILPINLECLKFGLNKCGYATAEETYLMKNIKVK